MITETQIIDLRSDTITKPGKGMREAMANAEVGDDVYGEDPTINALQDRCAEMFGMDASLFVPTGTMGNLIAIMCHCEGRGLEAIVGHKSHILLNEQGGIAQIAGVHPKTIHNKSDGTFDLKELEELLQHRQDPHQCYTRLICLENTHNYCGGKVLPFDFLKKVYDIAIERNIFVHIDGARILNAAAAQSVPVSEITKYCHSVNMCFSKGLAAPVGSILAGNKAFIAKALRMRKVLGGGMRQAGILAAAAMYSLDHVVPRLWEDNARAKRIAESLMEVNNGVIHIDLDGVHTNIVTIEVVKPGVTAADFCKRISMVVEEEAAALKSRIGIRMNPIYPQVARLLTHNDLTADMVDLAIAKLQYVVKEFGKVEE